MRYAHGYKMMMRPFAKQSVVTVGELLLVAAGFAVYYVGIGVIIIWIVYLILSCVHRGSGAALFFVLKTILPLGVIVGLLMLFSRVIKRSLSNRRGITAKKDGPATN